MTFSMIDTLWLLLGAILVFFMQAGFAMVETGFTRAKNAGNIIMKNLMDFVCGSIVYWIMGFGLMYGSDIAGLIGMPDWFCTAIQGGWSAETSNVPFWCYFIFNTMFCATTATIVSGAMAERTKFKSYLVYSVVISALIYPIEAHWIWGGGWLSQLGFHDYAGSTAVHMVGGLSALIGAKILGPRIGKYDKNGKPKAFPGHSLTLGALGVFILWFGWFGFNPASSYGIEGAGQMEEISSVFMTTNIAACCATLVAMLITWVKYGKPDVSMTLNGSLAGLVAITAGCATVDPWAAAVIGLLAGFVVVFGIEFIDKVLKIDDPVGAIGVHCFCGAFGTLAIGLFSNGAKTPTKGLFIDGSLETLGIQALGVVSVAAFIAVSMTIIFLIIKATIGLRATAHEEIVGLDLEEHGLASAYADFASSVPTILDDTAGVVTGSVAMDEAVPVQVKSVPAETGALASDVKMTKLDIVTKQSKFEALKIALSGIGITGMTVTNVLGCGLQKGKEEFYRGVPVDMTLLPKVKVEIVVCKIPAKTVINTAKKALYTGHIGDGKIFVYDVESVVKVRTGESNYDALQDS